MLERIESTSKSEREASANLYEISLARQKAEILSYRRQINPHFLYNTLECIRSMAQIEGMDHIERICLAMSKMFRYSVRDDDWVTVEDEISHVENYFTVMMERMIGTSQLKVLVTDEALNSPIQKMILQPIVENAIQHGFTRKEPPYNICIQGFLEGEHTLVIRITDNGVGIDDFALAKINEGIEALDAKLIDSLTGIGLMNINHRLQLVYHDQYELLLSSRKDHYTIVELRLPKQ